MPVLRGGRSQSGAVRAVPRRRSRRAGFVTTAGRGLGQSMKAELVIFEKGRSVRVVPRERGGRITLGRSPQSSVALVDPHISRHHCVIEEKGGIYVITDPGSINGTWVNGQRIKTATLSSGDKVRLGNTKIDFIAPEGENDGSSVPPKVSDFSDKFCFTCDRPLVVADIEESNFFEHEGKVICAECLEKDHLLGKDLGGCVLLRQFARGGTARLYEAVQKSLKRAVVVKVLSERHADRKKTVKRFLREARIGARLQHPNLVQIIDVGSLEEEGIHYIVMEYVQGKTMRQLIREQGHIPEKEALRLVLPVLEALDYLHARGVVHRDVKPANIIINNEGTVKLSDLGLSKSARTSAGLTSTGERFGTYQYMPPEQFHSAGDVDSRADIYSLGVTLYFMLSGEKPFRGATSVDLTEAIISGQFVPMVEAAPFVSENVAAVVEKMLSREPDDRYQDCGRILAELKAFLGENHVVGPNANVPGPRPGADGVDLPEQ